jgi:hypothetical protein
MGRYGTSIPQLRNQRTKYHRSAMHQVLSILPGKQKKERAGRPCPLPCRECPVWQAEHIEAGSRAAWPLKRLNTFLSGRSWYTSRYTLVRMYRKRQKLERENDLTVYKNAKGAKMSARMRAGNGIQK